MANLNSSIVSTVSSVVKIIKWSLLAFLGLFIFFSVNPFVNIEAGHRGVIFDKLRGGVQDETWEEGLHFRIPFFQSIIQMPVRTQKLVFAKNTANIPSARNPMSAASSDLQDVYIETVITYHLDPDNVQNIYQKIGMDYEAKKVVPSVLDSVKTFIAKYKVAEILTKRAEIKQRVFEDLSATLLKDNIILEAVDMTNFDFDQQYKNAIEQKQIEEQKAQKEEYILKQVEISSQQKVKKAEAAKKAKVLEGEGIAEYNKLIQQEITDKVLEFKKLENAQAAIAKWNGQYPQTYFGDGGPNSPIPLINLQK